ncbi:hypothetical protein VTP01DRAFT_1478 [Rhizomucor pusillus]|uniref:uncharacterized protein n=1 Tax=Rhizomucor pusillus TaxID=4840 RepID=UPI003742286E
MIDFIPFIPGDTEGIPKELYEAARDAWSTQFAVLHDLSDQEFRLELTNNQSLHRLVASVIDAQLDGRTVDTGISRDVFLLYVRAGEVATAAESSKSPVLQDHQLIAFAVVYGPTNPAAVRRIFTQLADGLLDTVKSTMDTLISCLVAPCDDQDRLYAIVGMLEALVSATMQVQPHLIDALFECHDKLPKKDDGPTTYLIKRSLAATLDRAVDITFFRPLGYDPEEKKKKDDEHVNDDTVVDKFSEELLRWIEAGDLETPREAFVDAPLIMDWEVEFHVSDKLQQANNALFNGNDERIEFLKLSMEQVRDMNRGDEPVWKRKLAQHKIPAQHAAATEAAAAGQVTESSQQPIQASSSDQQFDIVSKISQIQDLFPDLGEGFIEACLAANDFDTDMVVMQMLDNNLPPSVAGLYRSMPRQAVVEVQREETQSMLASRRNIFDNDEFDLLSGKATVDHSKVHMGKKSRGNAETILDDKSFMSSEKQNMLQRIYNMYEDEYDDTYDDINEVSGPVELDAMEDEDAVDIVKRSATNNTSDAVDRELLQIYIDKPDIFKRSARKSSERAVLRQRMDMTDEQLEAWCIMLDRNPRKQQILEDFTLFDGKQQALFPERRAREQGQQKSGEPNTRQRAFRERHKARFANHNRKRGHDKKMNKANVGNNA